MGNGNGNVRDGLAGAVVESSDKLAGAASLLRLLEEKAENGGAVGGQEISAIRCVVEACAEALESAWRQV